MEVCARAVRGGGLVKNMDLAHLDTACLDGAERVLGGEGAGAPTDEDAAGSLCAIVSVLSIFVSDWPAKLLFEERRYKRAGRPRNS